MTTFSEIVLAASLAFAASTPVPTPMPSFSATPDITPACRCVPTTRLDKQSRGKMKHRLPPATWRVTPVTIKDMIEWRSPNKINYRQVRTSNSPIADRESQVYTLTGYLWLVSIEANDCDFHLEISQKEDPEADRVIVEVPSDREYLKVWNSVAVYCKDRRKGKWLKPGASVGFRKPPKVKVTGFAFYDARHWSTTAMKKGLNHGGAMVATLWELHPCWGFEDAN